MEPSPYEGSEWLRIKNPQFVSVEPSPSAGSGIWDNRVPGHTAQVAARCLVDDCTVDLSVGKEWYRKHNVCMKHYNADVVSIRGVKQRFCQKCRSFHSPDRFDGSMKTCRQLLKTFRKKKREGISLKYSGENNKLAREEKSSDLNLSGTTYDTNTEEEYLDVDLTLSGTTHDMNTKEKRFDLNFSGTTYNTNIAEISFDHNFSRTTCATNLDLTLSGTTYDTDTEEKSVVHKFWSGKDKATRDTNTVEKPFDLNFSGTTYAANLDLTLSGTTYDTDTEEKSVVLNLGGKDKAICDMNAMLNTGWPNIRNLSAYSDSSMLELSKSLQMKMSTLSVSIRDIQEEMKIAQAQLHERKKRKRELENWPVDVQNVEKEHNRILVNEPQMQWDKRGFFDRGQAEKLSLALDDFLERSQQLCEFLGDVYDIRGEPSQTRMSMGEEFQKNLEKAMQLILVDKVPCLGIYGMAGVGKTVLARHIQNRLLEINEACVVWITVSQELTVLRMQDAISELIGLELLDEYDEHKRAGRLNMALSNRKNVFLVLDGVNKYIDLEKLGNPLSVDGCGLLVTSCTLEICRQIGCQKLIEVSTLNKDEGLSLFKQVLANSMSLTPFMQEIAKSMVGVCCGLPLGIIAIAGSMRGETNAQTWEDAMDELSVMGKLYTKGEFMNVLLYYCFDRLGRGQEKINNGFSRLQLCFLYCSLYPEDFAISGDELIRKFIQEELLGSEKESRKYSFGLGYAILNELVNSRLLESDCNGRVKMHNLMRSMAVQVSKGKLVWHKSETDSLIDKEWAENLEKKSLSCNGITEIPASMSPSCSNLSTLLLDSNPLVVIPDIFFLHFDALCVLDLSRTCIKALPGTLSDLEGLKALILTECHRLVHLPCVGKLKKLKELDLTLTAIEELPQGMEELINLKFLSLDKAYQLGMFPSGLLPKLQMLQCLYLPYHVHVQGEEVATLEHLEELRGRVNDACDFFQLIKGREGSLEYSVEVRSGFQRYKVDEFRGYNQLILSKYDFGKAGNENVTTLSGGIGIVRHLTLRACVGQSTCLVEDLSRINDPSSLESLEVDKCKEIECFLRREKVMNLGAESKPALPSAFLPLKNLEIFHCNKIDRLGLFPSQLPNLERMTIAYCKEVEDIMEVDEDKEAASPVSLPKLKCLLLEDLPRLKSICNTTTVCKSLETLSFWGCPKLKKMPLVFGPSDCSSPPSALKSICISECEIEWWKELELDHHFLDPFVTF